MENGKNIKRFSVIEGGQSPRAELQAGDDERVTCHVCMRFEGVDTIDYGDDGKIYETYTDGSKYLWTYDAETDKFTRTDSDGKVIESYDRYHPDYEKNLTTEAPVTTESATQKQDKTYYEKAEVEQSSDVIGEETEANAETQPTTAEAEATADDNGMSTGQIVVLSIIGGLIVIGGGTVGVMAVKKKKK